MTTREKVVICSSVECQSYATSDVDASQREWSERVEVGEGARTSPTAVEYRGGQRIEKALASNDRISSIKISTRLLTAHRTRSSAGIDFAMRDAAEQGSWPKVR